MNLRSFNPFRSSPSWTVDIMNWIQSTNKVLVNETLALLFISSVLKGIFTLVESHSKGVTPSTDKKRGSQPYLSCFNISWIDAHSTNDQKKEKKMKKSTPYLRHSSVPARLQKTWFVAKTLRARGRCFCWSADGKTRAWQDGCGQRGHWQIPGTLQRLREIWVVLILCSNRFFPAVHGAKRFSVEDGTGSKNALNKLAEWGKTITDIVMARV